MGSYLYFKLACKKQANKFNKYINNTDFGKKLKEICGQLNVICDDEIEWAKNGDCPQHARQMWIEDYTNKYGSGDWKASGFVDEDYIKIGCKDKEDFFNKVSELLIDAQKYFKMWFYGGSCAFDIGEAFFTIPQMQKITDYGKRLKFKKGCNRPELLQLLSKE